MRRDMSALVHIIDDDEAVQKAIRRLVVAAGYEAVCYGSAEEYFERGNPEGGGCAIVDLGLPGSDGLEVQARLAASGFGLPVVFLTGRGDVPSSVAAMKGGAVDFLTKPVDAASLLDAVRRALSLACERREERDAEAGFASRIGRLTPREREVLDKVVDGRLNKQIAAELGVAEKTIKVHRSRIMRKMSVRTLAELVRTVVTRRR